MAKLIDLNDKSKQAVHFGTKTAAFEYIQSLYKGWDMTAFRVFMDDLVIYICKGEESYDLLITSED